MTSKELLERAALCTESYVMSDQQQRIAKLMALHIIRGANGPNAELEAGLLMELMDEESRPNQFY